LLHIKFKLRVSSDLFTEKVNVKCNQTGRCFKVKVEQLSLESGHGVTEEHLVKGAQLLLDYKSKTYPVSVMDFLEATKEGKLSTFRHLSVYQTVLFMTTHG